MNRDGEGRAHKRMCAGLRETVEMIPMLYEAELLRTGQFALATDEV